MKLSTIGTDKWAVLAYTKDNLECPLLKFLLEDVDSKRDKIKMVTLLADYLPTNGPPHNTNISKHLDGKIFEFKKGPKKGPKIRVFYFYDKGNMIICTHGIIKRDDDLTNHITESNLIRERYLVDKSNGNIEIIKE